MNEEIKEILYLEKYIDKYKSDEKSVINGNRLTTPAMLYYLEVKNLLNYITNLEKENKHLKSELECYENGLYFSSEVDKLQEKINKAIDVLLNYGETFDSKIHQEMQKELLNILQEVK